MYDLVRAGLAELAAEARPVDLFPQVVRRTQRVRRALAIGAVAGAAAVLLGVPVVVAATGAGDAGRSTPGGQPSLSFAAKTSPPARSPSP